MKYLLPFLLALLAMAPLTAPAAETASKKKAPAKVAAGEKAPSAETQAVAKTLTPTQKGKLMELINKGDEAALQTLPGIGPTRAKAILKARPFDQPADLVRVNGIGDATFAEIVAHAKAGFPQPESGKEPSKAKSASGKKKAASDKKGSKE